MTPATAPGTLANGYAALLRAVASHCLPRERLTVSDWADKHRWLSGKASAEAGWWRTERTPFLREIMDSLSESSPVSRVVLMKAAQIGGPLDVATPVLTTSGWRTMGTLQVGDEVFSEQGLPVRVTYVSPVWENRECFELEFSDGATLVSDPGHRWRVTDHRSGKQRTVTTAEMLEGWTLQGGKRYRYSIPVARPLQVSGAECLPLSPYALGVWLGDGNSYSNQLTLHEDDAALICGRIGLGGHQPEIRKPRHLRVRCVNVIIDRRQTEERTHCIRGHALADAGTYSRGEGRSPVCAECGRQHAMRHKYGKPMDPVLPHAVTFYSRLEALGLIGHKRIPEQYLTADERARWALLDGLIDTDGHVTKGGRASLSTSSEALAADYMTLLCGLGLKPTVRARPAPSVVLGRPSPARLNWEIGFVAYRGCGLQLIPRKHARLRAEADSRPSETRARRLVNIRPVHSRPVRCIAVNNPTHLFLAGPRLIPTHNTEVGLNWIGYVMHHAPAPMLVVVPTIEVRKRWSLQRLEPLLRETKALADLISNRRRDAANGRDMKDFPGAGLLILGGANSPASLASMPVRYVLLDEVDRFPWEVRQEGDPIGLIDERTKAFRRRKVLLVSTPTIKGASRIEDEFEHSDQRHYHVPCPECGVDLILRWSGLQWTKDRSQVWYRCEHCDAKIPEHAKHEMLRLGKWVARYPQRDVRGYHISGLYAPPSLGYTWRELVAQFFSTKDEPSKFKRFINTALGETWEDRTRDIRIDDLLDRREGWRLREIPPGCLLLTAGVDTQDDRLAVHIIGWGADETCWIIDYTELPGDPARSELWRQLTDLLNRPLANAWGREMVVEATAIDSGGHHTHDVYAYCRARSIRRPMAIKGASTPNKPILAGRPTHVDVNTAGRVIKRGVRLWTVGTDTAKHALANRLYGDSQVEPGARRIRLPADVEADYLKQLTAEVFDPEKNRWVKRRGRRNEALDTWVYAAAAAQHPEVRAHTKRPHDWRALAAVLEPADRTPDTVAGRPAGAAPATGPQPTQRPTAKPAPAKRGRGWGADDHDSDIGWG